MNATILKALALDSLYQVLDNKVFRILLILVIVPVLGTFLFGFREDEVVLLFGLKSWEYGGIVDFFGLLSGSRHGLDDPQTAMINGLSAIVVDFLAGSIGVMFTIAAASFFVPRMIEKGAADVLFHKPIGRLTLYLSRYFAGLVFIALFAIALVGGMYLGFLLVSGHNDPGLLWAAVTLTYVFALVHGVSMLVGVMTRSTVAAILLTIIFFLMNGCVHGTWMTYEQEDAKDRALASAEFVATEPDEEASESTGRSLLRVLRMVVSTLHYLGPKTSDADHITAMLRAAVEGGDTFLDPDSRLAILELAAGLQEQSPDAAELPVPGAGELLGEARYHASDDGRSFTVWSRDRRMVEREFAGRSSPRRETASDAADTFGELLGKDLEPTRERVSVGDRSHIKHGLPVFLAVTAERFHWTAADRGQALIFLARGPRIHGLHFASTAADLAPHLAADEPEPYDAELEGRDAESVGAESVESEASWDELVLAETGVLFEEAGSGWYREQLGWTSELKYNLFFSIGSSLAFAAAMLLLGWWRLSRIDF